jgi:hypothetical protein
MTARLAALITLVALPARASVPDEAARALDALARQPGSRALRVAAVVALERAGQRSSAVERSLALLAGGEGFVDAARLVAAEPGFPLGGGLLERVDAKALRALPRAAREALELRLGLELLRRGATAEAASRLEVLTLPAAAYLAGVARLRLGASARARASFARAAAGGGESAELAALALARLESGEDPGRAALRYRSVPASSPYFFAARQELAWLLHARGDHAGALAQSGVLAAPHLARRSRPDRELLEAAALLGLCRLEEARTRLHGARSRLAADAERLRVFLRPRSDVRLYYVDALAALAGRGPALPARQLGGLLADASFRRAFAAVRQLQRERAGLLEPHAVTLRRALGAELDGRLVLGQRLAGETVARIVAAMARELAELRRRVDELRFDLEAQGIEALRGVGGAGTGEQATRQRGRLRWPFTGEYWSDELPFLEARISSRCSSRSLRR